MDVNFALGLLFALVFLASQPYNTQGRNICGKDLRKLQKRSSDDVVLLEGYEITPKDEERDSDCVKYETASPFPTAAPQTTTNENEPTMDTPVPTIQKPSKHQLCCLYYGMLVKMYPPMRNLPTLPNPQGNKYVYGPNAGGTNTSVNTRPRVVCWKRQRPMIDVNKVLQGYTNGGKVYQRGSAVQRLRGRFFSLCFG